MQFYHRLGLSLPLNGCNDLYFIWRMGNKLPCELQNCRNRMKDCLANANRIFNVTHEKSQIRLSEGISSTPDQFMHEIVALAITLPGGTFVSSEDFVLPDSDYIYLANCLALWNFMRNAIPPV